MLRCELNPLEILGGGDTCIKLWNLKDCIEGSIQCSIEENEKSKQTIRVQCICFHPSDHTQCYLIDDSANLLLYNNETYESEILANFQKYHQSFVSILALYDNSYLIIADTTTSILYFSLTSKTVSSYFKISKAGQEARLFSPKNFLFLETHNSFFTSAHTGYLTLWNLEKEEKTLTNPNFFCRFGEPNTIHWAAETFKAEARWFLITGTSRNSTIFLYSVPSTSQEKGKQETGKIIY